MPKISITRISLFLVAQRPDLGLLARQHPGFFIIFTEHAPETVLQEISSLVRQSLTTLNTRFSCILCHNTYTNQLEAIAHSHTHHRMQTRQKQRVCISNVIKDTSFYFLFLPPVPRNLFQQNKLARTYAPACRQKNLQMQIMPLPWHPALSGGWTCPAYTCITFKHSLSRVSNRTLPIFHTHPRLSSPPLTHSSQFTSHPPDLAVLGWGKSPNHTWGKYQRCQLKIASLKT